MLVAYKVFKKQDKNTVFGNSAVADLYMTPALTHFNLKTLNRTIGEQSRPGSDDTECGV